MCNCGHGFSGDQCQTNSCEGIICQNDGTCQEGIKSYICICKEGFGGTHCENYNGISFICYNQWVIFENIYIVDRNKYIWLHVSCKH